MPRYAQALHAFARKIGLRDYILMAGSMGGIIALYMLKNPRHKIRKLVLFGTPYDRAHFWLGKKSRWLLSLLLKTAVKSKIATRMADYFIGIDFLLSRTLKRSLSSSDQKKEIIEYEMRQWRVMPAKIWMETAHAILNVNFSREKIKTKIPTLIVAAKGETYIDSQPTIAGLQKMCPNSQVAYLPFKRHVPRGELTLKEVKRIAFIFDPFLNDQPTPKRRLKTK